MSCSPRILLAVLLALATPVAAGTQAPGDTPRMVLAAAGTSVPGPAGPFDNSGVLTVASGLVFEAQVSYLAQVPPNDDVVWALLVSFQQTPFPTDVLPPPLFTQPPFALIFPSPPHLDASGEGELSIPVPAGLLEGETFLQALVLDETDVPRLKLSNGVKVDVDAPLFNARFSFARRLPSSGVTDIQGVGTMDVPGEALSQHPPLGVGMPEPAQLADIGLEPGFRFLPIVPNAPDAPINPLARPMTRLTAAASPGETTFFVEDTRGFPPRGLIYVQKEPKYPWAPKAASINAPDMEAVTYTSKTATSFEGLTRKVVTSTGSNNYPHAEGEIVLGTYTCATTAGVLTRDRVGLDATNEEMIHVVIPETTFDAGPDEGEVTMELDLFMYEETDTGTTGFCVLDRTTHTWRVLEGTDLVAGEGRSWDPMVTIAPDGRSMIAIVRVTTGEHWPSDPDEVWAIRLDGLDWPASGSESWQIDYQLTADPDEDDETVRSRRVWTPSIAIIGPDSDNYIAYVGLDHKFLQTQKGTGVVTTPGGEHLSFEGFWVRENIRVRDYVEIPLVAPGSGKQAPPMPRPYITGDFGNVGSLDPPTTGSLAPVQRFDPVPLVAEDKRSMLITGSHGAADTGFDDIFVLRNVSITAAGEPSRQLVNISGLGTNALNIGDLYEVRPFDPGGHGQGQKAALSPSGTRAAWVLAAIGAPGDNADWIMTARLNGADFGVLQRIYSQVDQFGGSSFIESGEYSANRAVSQLHFLDDDRLIFLMGKNRYPDPFGEENPSFIPGYDVFIYTISTDTMVNVTRTNVEPGQSGFAKTGSIRPGAAFLSSDRRYFYVVRDGGIGGDNTSLPDGTQVTNILGIDTQSLTVFNVTGDEFPGESVVANINVPRSSIMTPVETLSAMQFREGAELQAGMMYYVAHRATDATETDQIFAFHREEPFVTFQATAAGAPGSHVSNLTPGPYSGVVAFARTGDANRLSNTQHPFAVDLDNFLFLRDLAPAFYTQGGTPFGRVMDGSLHFIPPTAGVGDALIFSFGLDADPVTGIATRSAPAYYPLANVSNTTLEPQAVVLPLLSTFGHGQGYRYYVLSAGPSESAGGE